VTVQPMNVALVKSQSGSAQDGLFAAARDRLPGAGPVREARERAFDAFTRQGLPHRRIEQWKYTDLRARLREIAPLTPPPGDASLAVAGTAAKALAIAGASTFVLVDGAFAPALSSNAVATSGLRVRTLRQALENSADPARADMLGTGTGEAMESLNAALATDGLVLEIADGVVLASPVHIVHVATRNDTSAFTRSVVTIGRDARATLVEQFVAAPGASAYQSHDAVVARLAEGAQLEHVRLME